MILADTYVSERECLVSAALRAMDVTGGTKFSRVKPSFESGGRVRKEQLRG